MSEWLIFLSQSLNTLIASEKISFSNISPAGLAKSAGVYLISCIDHNGSYVPYYVGRTTNFSMRLYTNHLMGNKSTARLKKYLVESGECTDMSDAKQFLLNNCHIQFVLENDYRKRGALEGYFTGVLFPKYGIAKEN